MAKDKTDKPRKERTDKATKREKKVARDAVEKSTTKDKKKSKRATTPSSSADENFDNSEGASLVETVSSPVPVGKVAVCERSQRYTGIYMF